LGSGAELDGNMSGEQDNQLEALRLAHPWLPPLECNAGWTGILSNLAQDLEQILGRPALMRGRDLGRLNADRRKNAEPAYAVLQVKEKFASLRVYMAPYHQKAQAAVDEAERISVTVCEMCGRTGEVRKRGWWKTLCTDHDIERDAERSAARES
jgi:hypothetical protein